MYLAILIRRATLILVVLPPPSQFSNNRMAINPPENALEASALLALPLIETTLSTQTVLPDFIKVLGGNWRIIEVIGNRFRERELKLQSAAAPDTIKS